MEVLRNLNDWKVCEYESLLDVLSLVVLVKSEDQLIWTLNLSESSSMGSFHKHLTKNDVMDVKFPSRQIRKVNSLWNYSLCLGSKV